MYEVEIKVRADHEPLRARLEVLDADSRGTIRQVDTYYDHPIRAFGETDEALRVRRESDVLDEDAEADGAETRVMLTYKGPLVETTSKTRTELETVVEDGETTAAILEELGFGPAATVEKRRERYAIDDYAVVLDSIAGLGEFVEIETDADEGEIDRARDGAFDLLESLGLDSDAQIRTSYLELLAASDE